MVDALPLASVEVFVASDFGAEVVAGGRPRLWLSATAYRLGDLIAIVGHRSDRLGVAAVAIVAVTLANGATLMPCSLMAIAGRA